MPCTAIAFSCFVLIIAQSAATSRSFAMKHGQRVDVNRDILGLAGANVAAGLTGTFVVNGSPTKTQILDEQKGRTQLANMTMSLVVLVVVLFLTELLTDMPKAVLGAIVFLIGIDLVDINGLRRIARRRRSEFVIARLTAHRRLRRRRRAGHRPGDRRVDPRDRPAPVPAQGLRGRRRAGGAQTYQPATPGTQSEPGLIVFRFDAELFYANASRFVDDIQEIVDGAPDPVRWLILDAVEPRRHRLLRRHRARRPPRLPRFPSDHVRHRPRRHRACRHAARLRPARPGRPHHDDTLDDAIDAFHRDEPASQ